MSEKPEADKKIIVDEDWKSRVEAEKQEALRKQQAETTAQPGAAQQAPAAGDSAEEDADPPLPPPNLLFLAGTLYMQALMGLGVVANPMTGKSKVRVNQARHAIDALEVLRAKTEGNRSADESAALDNMLHELRMAFVAVQQQAQS